MIVVADTTPINYLVLTGRVDLLRQLFAIVVVPTAVYNELAHSAAPNVVRDWVQNSPAWLRVQSVDPPAESDLDDLDDGEREAILLAEQIRADYLLADETEARREAAKRKLPVIGTLGILRKAAHAGLTDLPSALDDLKRTSFYINPELMQSLLDEHNERRR